MIQLPQRVLDAAWLPLRIGAGLLMATHGWPKVQNIEGFAGAVEGMGFPAPLFFAWVAALAELVGGLLVAAGALTRSASLSVALTMAAAAFLRHGGDPLARKEKALLYLLIFAAFALAGGGPYSVDRLWARRKRG